MAITYAQHLWFGTDGYKNFNDDNSRIRIKKLEDGKEIKNLDVVIPTAEITSLSEPKMQALVDAAIKADEDNDDAVKAKEDKVVPGIEVSTNAKTKGLTTNSQRP